MSVLVWRRTVVWRRGVDGPVHGHCDFAAFVCELSGDTEVVLSDEHDRYEWVSVDEACRRCLPARVAETIRAAPRHLP